MSSTSGVNQPFIKWTFIRIKDVRCIKAQHRGQLFECQRNQQMKIPQKPQTNFPYICHPCAQQIVFLLRKSFDPSQQRYSCCMFLFTHWRADCPFVTERPLGPVIRQLIPKIGADSLVIGGIGKSGRDEVHYGFKRLFRVTIRGSHGAGGDEYTAACSGLQRVNWFVRVPCRTVGAVNF